MPQQLKDIEVDEVSLVDRPANRKAKVVLMKREDPAVDADMDEDFVQKAPAGIEFLVGYKAEGGSDIQSVLFQRSQWKEGQAKKWLKAHKFKGDKLDKPENGKTLRFRQSDPGDYKRIRIMTPGKQMSKALSTGNSFQAVQRVVESSVRDVFQSADARERGEYIWLRDLFDSSAVFDQEGQTYRVEYELDTSPTGETEVRFGEKIPVEVVYQDVAAKAQDDSPATSVVPDSVVARFGKLQSGLEHLVQV